MKVSIIIPCHNVAQHLSTCLDSALGSTYKDIEVICVDDGSTDGTAAIIEQYKNEHPDMVLSAQQKNMGASAARNFGMTMASGQYVQFLDGDDVLMKNKISEQMHLIQQGSGADLVVGNYEKKRMDGTRSEVVALAGDPWMALIRTELGTTSANLWKRAMLNRVGGWNEALRSSQDYELMFRILCADAKVVFDPLMNTLILKREKGSISQTGQKENWVRYIELRARMRAHLVQKDRMEFEQHINSLDQYIFMALRVLARFDVDRSIALFKQELGKGFIPKTSRAVDGRYLLFYKLLGYSIAERIIHSIKRSAA